MKLGEALAERARLQRKIGELRARINANTTRQEDTETAEDPNALIEEIEQAHEDLSRLIGRINMTNATRMIGTTPADITLTELLAERDRLAGLTSTYTHAAEAAQSGPSEMRYMRSELKLARTVDVKDLRSKADEVSAALRKLDNRVQEINWTTELKE